MSERQTATGSRSIQLRLEAEQDLPSLLVDEYFLDAVRTALSAPGPTGSPEELLAAAGNAARRATFGVQRVDQTEVVAGLPGHVDGHFHRAGRIEHQLTGGFQLAEHVHAKDDLFERPWRHRPAAPACSRTARGWRRCAESRPLSATPSRARTARSCVLVLPARATASAGAERHPLRRRGIIQAFG